MIRIILAYLALCWVYGIVSVRVRATDSRGRPRDARTVAAEGCIGATAGSIGLAVLTLPLLVGALVWVSL